MTIWLSKALVMTLHDEQLAEHGGAGGLRDDNLLESALARPANAAAYGEPGVAELGALHAIGVARNHPFIDGNKRAGFMAMVTFLALNGEPLEASEAEAVVAMLAMAGGELTDAQFVAWVGEHARPD